jgi:hypothetical protein
MSRNNKNATRKAQAKVITALHAKGEKGPVNTGSSKKTNAWWMKGDYKTFTSGGKKRPQEA